MAGILLTKKRVYAFLESLGYTPVDDTISVKTGTYRFWKTRNGHVFPVNDQDYAYPTWVLEKLVADLESKKL